jgi:nitrite reductase (NO-forming)
MNKHLMAMLAVLAIVAAACGNGDAPTDEPAEPAVGGDNGTVEIDVVMGDIFYQPDSVEIPAGTTLVVNANNEGAIEHDFELEDGQGTGMVQPGESATGEIGPFDESTVAFCTVPGHREAGMEFDITVTD